MANYYHLAVRDAEYPSLFYRSFFFKDDETLATLGEVIGLSIGASMRHEFGFRDEQFSYESAAWLKAGDPTSEKDYAKTTLADLALGQERQFSFTYNFEEDYTFDIVVGTTMIERPGTVVAYCLSGAGAFIYEDNHALYEDLLEGKPIDAVALPKDHPLLSRGEFLKKVDTDALNLLLQKSLQIRHENKK